MRVRPGRSAQLRAECFTGTGCRRFRHGEQRGATTQALTALIFAGSDDDIDITGKPTAVERFRRLISTMATVVHPV